MIPDIAIDEIWSLRVNPSDLFNIERPLHVNPDTGGGQLYIQVGKRMVSQLLNFLGEEYPPPGMPIRVAVRCQGSRPELVEVVEFDSKSQGRMRITNQNRYRKSRLYAWSPENGFPSLPASATTTDAQNLVAALGGIHIYLARDVEGEIWAGYTTGATPPSEEANLPFTDLLYGSHPGGHWRYEAVGP